MRRLLAALPGRAALRLRLPRLRLGIFGPRAGPEVEQSIGAVPLTARQAERAQADARRARRARSRRIARTGAVVVAGGAVVLALLVGVFPTRTWLDQRAGIAEAEQRLGVLRDQNAVLEARIERLDRDDEIERLAREQYNLVLPGEEAYAVLPPPLPPVELPALWPFGPLIDE